jgi:DNA helicase-2/ATP-dependent DNA helicase PcrA
MSFVGGSTVPDSEHLAAYRGSGYIVAPAGFGKTHLIAASLRHAAKRQLVLTHTYAGVNALRRKARQLRVPDGACRVDTIASWALRLCLSYSETSRWSSNRPGRDQWPELYRACADLLDCGFIRRIIRASYDGMYIDEYQDCSPVQHTLVLKLARDLPCRILGDPLQGIFDFDGNPIDWNRDVAQSFEFLGALDTPHRWNLAGAPSLGQWLGGIRAALENGDAINLAHELPDQVTVRIASDDGANLLIAQGNTCRRFRCDRGDSVIAIHKGHPPYKGKCHSLAKRLGGRFVSIEEIEGKDLFSFLAKIQGARNDEARLKHACAFAETAMTGVRASLPAGTARGEHVDIRNDTRNPGIARAGNTYLSRPTSGNLATFLETVKGVHDVRLARADLFNRAVGVLKKHSLVPHLTLAEAAEKYQTQFRHRGRPVGRRRLIGTTLLVKGLEFHHGIVLDASSLSRKELYVAFTRGAKSLTIISTSSTLNPAD